MLRSALLVGCLLASLGSAANAKDRSRNKAPPELKCRTSKDCGANQRCVKTGDVGVCRRLADDPIFEGDPER